MRTLLARSAAVIDFASKALFSLYIATYWIPGPVRPTLAGIDRPRLAFNGPQGGRALGPV